MSDDLQARIAHYNALVREYEAIDQEIRAYLTQHGKTDELREGRLVAYREMARRRDDLFSEIRSIEQELFTED
jgi:hypothetical protein